jgi:hypothetical protein
MPTNHSVHGGQANPITLEFVAAMKPLERSEQMIRIGHIESCPVVADEEGRLFPTPLERSALEAAIQAAYGVAGVVSILYRERGVTPNFINLPDTIQVHPDQILRVDNDPSRPERGTLKVVVNGGK